MTQPTANRLSSVTLTTDDANLVQRCQAAAEQFGLVYVDSSEQDPTTDSSNNYHLLMHTGGILLCRNNKSHGPIRIDFTSGRSDHRRRFGGGKGQPLVRAIGLNKPDIKSVTDATAGFGADAFVLASLGARVTLIERSPVLALMLDNALTRARQHADTAEIAERMVLEFADATTQLLSISDTDVVYLDPMYPVSSKTAAAKKTMQALQSIVGEDRHNEQLLQHSLETARKRVVVKRPKGAPVLANTPAHTQIESPNTRYDIYLT